MSRLFAILCHVNSTWRVFTVHHLRKDHKKKSLHIQLDSFLKVIWCCCWLDLWMWKSDSIRRTYMKTKCAMLPDFSPVFGWKDDKAMTLTLPSARLKSHPHELVQSLLFFFYGSLDTYIWLLSYDLSFCYFFWVVLNLGCILKNWWLSHTPELQI